MTVGFGLNMSESSKCILPLALKSEIKWWIKIVFFKLVARFHFPAHLFSFRQGLVKHWLYATLKSRCTHYCTSSKYPRTHTVHTVHCSYTLKKSYKEKKERERQHSKDDFYLIFLSKVQVCQVQCHKVISFIILWKHLVHYEKKNMTKEAPDCWAAKILYQANMRKNFSVRTTTAFLSSQMLAKYFFSLKYRPSLQVIADNCWKRACKTQKNKCSFLSDPKPDHQIENGNRQLTTGVSKW